jgi:hypothetical protein
VEGHIFDITGIFVVFLFAKSYLANFVYRICM